MSLSFNPSSVLALVDAIEHTFIQYGEDYDEKYAKAILVGRAYARFKREMDAYLEHPDRVALGSVRKYRRLLDGALADFQVEQSRRPNSLGALR